MPRHDVPTPVAVALGVVPTLLSGIRTVPGKAVQLPILALSSTLTALDQARREYDELAARGQQVIARLRGESPEGTGAQGPADWPETQQPTGALVASVVEQVRSSGASPAVDRDELPLPDYDHMTLGSLRGRLRSLDLAQLVQIREYEQAHADRLPVVTMLDHRIARLATEAGTPA